MNFKNHNGLSDVHLFVLDSMADWEPAFAIAHINRPAPGIASKYCVKTVGIDRKIIRSMGGITIQPDMSLDELVPEQSSMLILPGSDLWTDTITDAALAKAKDFVDSGVPVAAICGAVFGLARVGLLGDRRHTGNDPNWLASSGYRGMANYVQQPAVEDDGIITASVTSSLEFAKLILGRLGVFSLSTLEAWYNLYKTGNPEYYFEFMEALSHEEAKQVIS
ncbi:MAG: glutamine amidotransferase [Desulfobacterales bacterium]|nr:glutamine amidotransferase [Desulfobacterales bacterium]